VLLHLFQSSDAPRRLVRCGRGRNHLIYTYRLSRDEIRGLMEHYKLIGTQWAEQFSTEMDGKNDEALAYPN
jgi:hypothetical protein